MKRLFLIDTDVNLKGKTPIYTEIAYVCENPRIALIQRGNKYYLGEIKGEFVDFDSEDLKEISSSIYTALGGVVKVNHVKYDSYLYSSKDGTTVTIKKYLDENEGRTIAEVSFSNPVDHATYDIPVWFGDEIKDKKDLKRAGFMLKNKPYNLM